MTDIINFHGQITPDHIQNTSDDTLAVTFVDENVQNFRFIGQWNKWRAWDGVIWHFDHKLRVYDHARKFLRTKAKGIAEKIFKISSRNLKASSAEEAQAQMREARNKSTRSVTGIQSANKVHAIVNLARSDTRFAIDADKWDSDPWLLNTPGGAVDLRTGTMRRHDPLDYMTKVTRVSPSVGAPTEWLRFLSHIMKDDADMVRYLQKVFGYFLVGDTKEHEMYFGYGTGRNGKGTVSNTIRGLMGDYGIEANIETFTISSHGRHPTELADLQGARLVTCGEIDQGQRWAEARIKQLTGGDPIKARFMRQDFFEFQPQFKLFLFGNHKPSLSNVDPAIESRMRLIPFTQYIPPEARDKNLGDKLRAEWPMVLNWCIEGCLAWQSEGLRPPQVVADATKTYLSGEDDIKCWLDECCSFEPGTFTYMKGLFESWKAWAKDNDVPHGSERSLSRLLEDRQPLLNIQKLKRNKGIGFEGMELLTPVKDA